MAKESKEYKRGYGDASKAFGGCTNCYGKGYATALQFAGTSRRIWKMSVVHFCRCPRGKQLRSLVKEK